MRTLLPAGVEASLRSALVPLAAGPVQHQNQVMLSLLNSFMGCVVDKFSLNHIETDVIC